ncbi:DUF3558 domain-containing protein [Amycolatopsis sp. H20-H5]|uniref:DUF3558 domain-containing protein n=1 Tax=Amycolatopsis sp. H20-H5 TaxID=3046309 RepID=UPI002DBA6931|nr:DUF3558 domain-containing protein [Amycolatopsis sp. H20-H5]MEC3978796.1 DUF3558 domain-containing protein [Amycolatopsis sp. H20-H5]
MPIRKAAALLPLAALSVLFAGCSGKGATPTSTPSVSPQPPTASKVNEHAVPQALETKSFEAAPCSAPSPEQVAGLGAPLKSATPRTDPEGPGCSIRFATDNPNSVVGTIFTSDHSGMSGLYEKQQQGGFTDFKPFTVSGYPGAVFANVSTSDPAHCSLAVGLRDDLTYSVSVSLDSATTPLGDPCALGKKVAGFVVEYLKKAQN